jgi:Fungal fucose-specific lectin
MLRRSRLMTQRRLTISLALLFLLSFTTLSAHADHIHYLNHNNAGWFDQDLTVLTNATLPNSATGVAAFSTTGNNRLHVYYATTDQHVHELFFNNTSWSDQDLTAITGQHLSLGFGGIAGFAIGQQLHVFYLGNDLHVHQLFFNSSTWADQDVTALAGGVVTDFNSLVAFPTTPDNHFHIFYLSNNSNDIHELNFNGSTWSDQDLRTISNQPPADRGWMAGFAVGTQQHLFFTEFTPRDKRHLAHLVFKNSKWVSQDVSAQVHALPLSPGAGITAFAVTATQIEAYCVTNDFDVHQFTLKNNTWTDEDLTGLAGQQSFGIGGMVAFKTTPNNQFHLFYPPNDIDQLFFDGTNWSDIDLTTLTGGGIPNGKGGMAGFAIKNLQHAFYVAQ